eukprot:gb/GECG01011998.1/.p1 GENE.gb/GECG01011998.1/~~gb/GECG01011998.1/.p1  ORF type:complete len:324 (+),score=63.44 gb/GECG01011998.1/:1-972(+)
MNEDGFEDLGVLPLSNPEESSAFLNSCVLSENEVDKHVNAPDKKQFPKRYDGEGSSENRPGCNPVTSTLSQHSLYSPHHDQLDEFDEILASTEALESHSPSYIPPEPSAQDRSLDRLIWNLSAMLADAADGDTTATKTPTDASMNGDDSSEQNAHAAPSDQQTEDASFEALVDRCLGEELGEPRGSQEPSTQEATETSQAMRTVSMFDQHKVRQNGNGNMAVTENENIATFKRRPPVPPTTEGGGNPLGPPPAARLSSENFIQLSSSNSREQESSLFDVLPEPLEDQPNDWTQIHTQLHEVSMDDSMKKAMLDSLKSVTSNYN